VITNKINGNSNLESLSAILKREVKYDPATEDLTFIRVVFDPAIPPPLIFPRVPYDPEKPYES
jgi:hypothetical protein